MRKSAALVGAAMAVAATLNIGVTSAYAAGGHALIQGSGSGWSANAVNQWVADVQPNGLQVVYTATGSAQGRKDFANKTTDYAVSDIGYQGHDPVSGDEDTSLGRQFAYLPVVAGGTALPYHLSVGGQLVRNLRLSGPTLVKIFTNQITNWNDPAISTDNNGRKLPSLPIIPVVHSEGAGSTAQFTRYFAKMFPDQWKGYTGYATQTEYYPVKNGTAMKAQNGSDGVMNFIASSAANGSIGYDEYSYALAKNYPVAKLENTAGYFTAPTQYNVAVALTQAVINMDKNSPDYLLQNLDKVYVDPDRRTYPMSSYSYMIIPTASDDSRMTTSKRQTLADFLYYAVCQGQQEMGPIGYSPLPINLVQASFDQTAKLKQADPSVDLSKRDVSTCHNPTFIAGQPKRNYLAEIAPQPPACDKAGSGPCTGNEGLVNGNPSAGKPTAGKSGGSTGRSTGVTSGSTAVTSGSTSALGAPASVAGGVPTSVDPVTGAPEVASGSSGSSDSITLAGVPTTLPADGATASHGVLALLAIIEFALILTLPPLVARRLRRRGTPT